MKRTKLAAATVALLLTAGLAGCLSTSAVDQSAADGSAKASSSGHETSREELSKQKITFEPAAGEWAVTRFTVDQLLGDRTEANLSIVAVPDEGAQPYVGVVLHATLGNESMPFSFFGAMADEPSSQTIRIESSGGDGSGEVDLAILVGSNGAGSTFHLGLTEGARAQRGLAGQNRSLVVPMLAERPTLDVDPDATGEGGAAGTAMVKSVGGELQVVERGNLHVTADDATAPVADVQRGVRIGGDGSIPDAGIGSLLLAADGRAGADEWQLDASLPPATWDADAIDAHPGGPIDVLPHEIREMIGVDSAVAYGSLKVQPGEASLDFERAYTGLGRETVASWGWATFDPAEVYGWEWTDFVV